MFSMQIGSRIDHAVIHQYLAYFETPFTMLLIRKKKEVSEKLANSLW